MQEVAVEEPAAGFRASPQQRHLWSLAEQTGVPLWTQLAVAVEGELDIDRLDAAVRLIVARHEALRTRVGPAGIGTAPVQIIDATAWGLSGEFDFAAVASSESERLDGLMAAERARLDVAAGPPARVALAHLGAHRWWWVLTASALVADGRSLRVVVREIAAAYTGEPLAPVVVQYADYAAWHNDVLGDAGRTPRRGFWDGHLGHPSGDPQAWPDLGHAVSLVGDESPAPSGPWHTCRSRVDGDVGTAVVAGTWAALLWRLSGEREMGLTATVAGRSYTDLDAAVGPFAREVPLVARFEAADGFGHAVERIRSALGDAIEHADDLDPARQDSPRRFLLPSFEFVEEFAPIATAGLVLAAVCERSRRGSALALRAGRDADGAWLELGYDADRLTSSRARDLLARMVTALADAAATPSAILGDLSLVLPGEAERLIAAAQGSPARSGSARLPELFAAQVRRTPRAVAVVDPAATLTYAQLEAASDRLASHLSARGLTPGGRAVVMLPRGADLLVSLLAVLKAGGAYVPVDTRQPARRLGFVLTDVAAQLVIVGPGQAVPATAIPVVRLGADAIVSPDDQTPPEPGHGDDVAYVIYTSGSTGVPNGVEVTHDALANYLRWAAQAYELGRGTGALVHSPVDFDLTVTAMLGPLVVGQRVVMVPEGLDGLVAALRAGHDLTMVKLTPSHLAALAQLIDPSELVGRVRTLVLGGEALHAETIQPWRSRCPEMRIINEYGPTEATVGCCAHEVDAQTTYHGSVPIGSPIAGLSAYVLDRRARLVPDATVGELYLGGVGLARGYLNRSELTRERFVTVTGLGRLYRTGDRVCRRADGALVYLGRVDSQLKVRGVRVEPAEVEIAIGEHSGVGAAAVALAEHGAAGGSGERLVAFLVAAGARQPTASELIAWCRDWLPDQLIPTAWTWLEALPTTPNGKLDRAALRGLPVAVGIAGEHVPARDETEEILTGAIAGVLGLERVGIDDNYFAVGGDSIRSVMVASRCQARGLTVSVADLHQHPTVRELAAALVSTRSSKPEAAVEAFSLIDSDDRALLAPDVEDAFPLNLLQEGMIFHRDFAAKSAVYHAIASVRLRAPLNLDVMRSVIHQLIRRHPMLRTSFDQTTFSRPLQLVHGTFRDPLSYEDLRGLDPGEQQARVAAFVEREKQRGFDLDEYPLIRFMVQPLDEETFQFTYGFHHEIVDGWSEALMVTELFGHYFSVLFDEPIALATPTSSMRDAVALELEALQRQENYEFWSRYLEGASLMRLPRWLGAPAADTGAREIVRLRVEASPGLSDALKRLAVELAVPLKSVLLAAHMAVMNLYHGQDDTLTYTVTNGRPESADGSTAIGLFVNSLALRLRMTGGTWQELITQTLDSERQSLAYRRLPMAELKRHQGNEPLAETLFFFTDYHVFRELDRWRARGVEHVASELYGESTFPFCAIFRLSRETAALEVRLEYDSLQFPSELMHAIGDSYVRVLDAMVADPQAAYHTGCLLDARERQVLVEWSGSQNPPAVAPVERIHDIIASRSRATPDAIAVETVDAALSYGELDRLAAQVGRVLRAHGAGPDVAVGVLAGRDIETVIAILGILKAGAMYLPLDTASPDERLATVVSRAGAVAVLAGTDQIQRLRDVPVIPIGAARPQVGRAVAATAVAQGVARLRAAKPAAAHGAYVIYTSGSTGAPKGVVVSHASIVASTLCREEVYALAPQRFLLLSPFAFDSSLAGLFWTLCTGQTLVLAAEGAQREPAALTRHVQEKEITHTLGVPSLLAAVLEAARPGQLRSMRVVIAAGEASSVDLLDELRRAAPDCAFFNEYGPTENTVWSTVFSGEAPAHRRALPIGRPVPGVRAYVLSTHLQPVPVGVSGELYLGGAGVARGYLGHPGLTAASFLPDPAAAEPGSRCYRSGDLARHTPDGELEFLGRVDHQVKIRGFRVELGEIEGMLDGHPDVHRSVVVAPDNPAGERMLVAYVAPRPGALPDPGGLHRYLRDRLPKYMVPGACVVLDTLPLTATGKVDRAALPVPAQRDASARTAPRTETEHVLVAIIAQVLGRDDVGLDDDFFDLGGESLRAMQVVTRTNRVFGLDLSVRTLFDLSTVAAFAQAVDEARSQPQAVAAAAVAALVD